ncbi:hypothetical protein A2U01_0087020, partial [Trifolium medium]|nr:hypothetical protein [Trifolium medium]
VKIEDEGYGGGGGGSLEM